MAGSRTEGQVTAEIEELKSVARCKIIKNVGDFTFLINATIPDTDVLIKFQLTAQYPQVAAGLFIKHPSTTKDDIQKVISSIPAGTTSLLELFHYIRDHISDLNVKAVTATTKQPSSPSSHRNKKKPLQNLDSENGSSKKPSMRTAADVIKRIQWDSSLLREAFIVGYIDRFLGIQEQPFTAFNWVNPAEADWMDLNIPEHRIEYFKYNGTIVWEKKSRVDNVFGSTGGMTIDQFLTQGGASTDCQPILQSETEVKEPIVLACDAEQKKSHCEANKPSDVSISPQVKKESRDRPNHFIAIPITDNQVVKTIEGIQDEYLTLSESDGEQSKKELYNLHITLCAVRINNQNDLDAVTEVLYESIMDREFQQEFPLGKLGSFWGRVLYATAELGETFTSFVLELRKLLVKRGIRIYDDINEFLPHITIFNFSRSQSRDIHFPIADFIAIKSDDNSNVLADVVSPLEQIVIYSMERDEANRYIQHIALDVHS